MFLELKLVFVEFFILVTVGDLYSEHSGYFICIEQKVITRLKSFEKAFAYVFGCHYVYNMEYHSGVAATLDFIQRYRMYIMYMYM